MDFFSARTSSSPASLLARCATATVWALGAAIALVALQCDAAAQESAPEATTAEPAPEAAAPEAAAPEGATPASEGATAEAAAPPAGAYTLEVPTTDPLSLRDDGWDLQWNGRIGLGFGSTMGSLGKDFIFETVIRGEALFGRKGDEHPRLGPGLALRTNTFNSWEMGGTLAATFPVFRGFPIFLAVGAGYAFREAQLGGDSGYFDGTFAWGYRSYNHENRYQIAIQAYVTTRVHTDDTSAYEITGGITFDLALAFGIVPLFTATYIESRGRPHESLREDPSWRSQPPPERAPGFDPASRAAQYEEEEDDEAEEGADEAEVAPEGTEAAPPASE